MITKISYRFEWYFLALDQRGHDEPDPDRLQHGDGWLLRVPGRQRPRHGQDQGQPHRQQ